MLTVSISIYPKFKIYSNTELITSIGVKSIKIKLHTLQTENCTPVRVRVSTPYAVGFLYVERNMDETNFGSFVSFVGWRWCASQMRSCEFADWVEVIVCVCVVTLALPTHTDMLSNVCFATHTPSPLTETNTNTARGYSHHEGEGFNHRAWRIFIWKHLKLFWRGIEWDLMIWDKMRNFGPAKNDQSDNWTNRNHRS